MAATRLLVLDMDNTLYDWRAHFCAVFEPLLRELASLLRERPTELKAQFRALHQSERHMECWSVVQRLPSVCAWAKSASARASDLNSLVQSIVESSRSTLRPYPGVEQSLAIAARSGWEVVVFTESPAISAAGRLQALGLGHVISVVYGAPGCLGGTSSPGMRCVVLPPFAKPAPGPLLDIAEGHGASVASTIYVGDSLGREISMADAAGITSVWARYGSHVDPEHRHIISEVSCWSTEKADRELEAVAPGWHKPDHIIDSFSELAGLLTHCPRRSSPLPLAQEG